MGWSSATGEDNTAVAPLNLTEWIYRVSAGGPVRKPLRWGEMWERNPRPTYGKEWIKEAPAELQ